jgi:hypothetical protein
MNAVEARLEKGHGLSSRPIQGWYGDAVDHKRRKPGVACGRRVEQGRPVRTSVSSVEGSTSRNAGKSQPAEVELTHIRDLTSSRV